MSRVALQIESFAPESRRLIAQTNWASVAGLEVTNLEGADAVLSSSANFVPTQTPVRPTLLTTSQLTTQTAELAGVAIVGNVPDHEIRIRLGSHDRQALAHSDQDLVATVQDSPTLLKPTSDEVKCYYSFAIGLKSFPVFTYRPSTGIALSALGNNPSIWQDESFLRLLHKFIHQITETQQIQPIRVGLLGFGAIGNEHSSRIAEVEGMSVTAICDNSPDRLATALANNPGASTTSDASELIESDVDLIIVSTPPNSHAAWGLKALEADKHVVLEKPMALTVTECDEMLNEAKKRNRLVSVYQNRRWDPDFLVIEQAIKQGRLGEVFRVEAFVGGYGHPCNFWHSDQEVSGGAIFDWGSHLIDQILQIAPAPVASVSATNLKMVWHDVTNADHSIVSITFTNDATAEFTHSDIAAALKPRWYILGTHAAIVGHWRKESVISRNNVGTLHEDRLAPADAPAEIQLFEPNGSITKLEQISQGQVRGVGYHQQLADHLHFGLPMTISPKQSRDVIAIMQAAEESAKAGGTPVIPEL